MGSFFRHLTVVIIATAATLLGGGSALAEVRVALVIGNSAYRHVPALPNPANDANDVAAALRRLGFQTILATDQDKAGMDEAEIRFARAARNADVAMFYYSGHALQFAGVNYLIPIDAQLTDEADLKRMVRVDELVSDLQQAKNLRILVLDSCRNNPLADDLKRSMVATRAVLLERGMARMDTPQGMIVAYSTQAGRVAYDGDDAKSRNSPYTKAFLKDIEAQDEIGTIFRQVSADVYDSTDHRQLPELSLSIIGTFYLRGVPQLDVKPQDTAPRDFDAAKSVDTAAGWDAFLRQHPEGLYATLAKELRAKAQARLSAAQSATPPPSSTMADAKPQVPVTPVAAPATSSQANSPANLNLWWHNGSQLELRGSADHPERQFFYYKPSARIDGLVSKGTLLFSGQKIGDRYSGTIRRFHPSCPPVDYHVEGLVHETRQDIKIVMRGTYPRLDANTCQPTGYSDEELTFVHIE